MESSIIPCWLIVCFACFAHGFPDKSYSYIKSPSHRNTQSYLPALDGSRPGCAGPSDTFCTKIEYYPAELIEDLVKRYSFDFKTLLQDESMEVTFNFKTASRDSIENSTNLQANFQSETRQPFTGPYGNTDNEQWWTRYARLSSRRSQPSVMTSRRVTRQVPNEEKLCPTTSSYIMPRAAVNTKGQWMYVVNLEGSDQLNSQLVRTERCATTECSGLCQVPAGYTATCAQQYVQKRLVALNGNGENLYTDTFWFPHCCICQIKSQF